MKNKDFFYLQYDKLNWKNQEKTKINSFVNDLIINEIISKKSSKKIKVFDIGFGIGFFLRMVKNGLLENHDLLLGGCEPSEKNYGDYMESPLNSKDGLEVQVQCSTFQKAVIEEKFDFVTGIYVFPHFGSDELVGILQKIHSILEKNGRFILVVANQKYLEEKLKVKKDLFIETNKIFLGKECYREILHYSELPEIGTIIDYNREEGYYLDLFKNNKFKILEKRDLNDNGFVCTVYVFGREE